ncbi:DDE_4 domain-containing protein [Cephalotus follicularis]|uniref:DDE_4 domain-containing protein n=1 Tax=Cephalotus follicularis TaxID=3775 RepID=A0A1Q3D8D6_CEPFO|nr:DDE_4 domain-containing protein [Cephalotus follicularis]
MEIREFLVGGVDYPLLPWLITTYESNGLLASISDFHAVHEDARLFAVRTFLQLKGSWRILNNTMWRPDKRKLPSVILVCCLLHNIIIDSGDQLHPDVALFGHDDSGYRDQCCKHVDPTGRTLRENLAKHLQHCKEMALSKQSLFLSFIEPRVHTCCCATYII